LDFKKNQSDYISQGCQDCINNRPEEFGVRPFYIFAHGRTIEADERISIYNQDLQEHLINQINRRKYRCVSDVPSMRLIWDPRLTKPKAQTNSMLFKAYPATDTIKIIWMIPERSMWSQYQKGNLTESSIITESIHEFEHSKKRMEEIELDDLSDDEIHKIYQQIARRKLQREPE
jgi:hypothetical protein